MTMGLEPGQLAALDQDRANVRSALTAGVNECRRMLNDAEGHDPSEIFVAIITQVACADPMKVSVLLTEAIMRLAAEGGR